MKKILLTGGETGGHIYPLIALAEELKNEKINTPSFDLEYIGPRSKYIKEFQNLNIKTHTITGAKIRRYFDPRNFLAVPKFVFSLFEALAKLFFIMPDAVVIKGGSGSIAISFAAWFYLIPTIIHESDSVPSLTTQISSKFADKVALAFDKTKKYFPEKGVVVGNPIRKEITQSNITQREAKKRLGFNTKSPLIFVMGGSQGSRRINELILSNLSKFTSNFQIFHQVGPKNTQEVAENFNTVTKEWVGEKRSKYKFKGNLSAEELKVAYKAADVVVSRAGSAIFEIASLGKPSILIPLPESAQNHQKRNAYTYAKGGRAEVIEEPNFTANLLIQRINNILQNDSKRNEMIKKARGFAKPEASSNLIQELTKLIS